MPALLPGSGPVATPAAWAVERSADTVTVTVNDLRDPQGLQRTLIADGVPALVQFGYQSCVYQASSVDPAGLIVRHRTPPGAVALFDIRPAALPAHTVLNLWIKPAWPGHPDPNTIKSAAAIKSAQPGQNPDAGHPAVAARVLPEGTPRCESLPPSPSPAG